MNLKENIPAEEKILRLAWESGFSAVSIIDTKDFIFVPEYRRFCEENRCGNYGKNYGCPPVCGTPEEMRDKVLCYKRGLVLQSKRTMKNVFDPVETKRLKKEHTALTLRLIQILEEEGLGGGHPIMAGPCNLCETCHMAQGRPCPHERQQFSCLSAYCIDAGRMAQKCGMEMSWSGDMVSFFSVYLFDMLEN